RACTVPRFSRNWTSSSATTPGNSLRIPSAVRRYSALGAAPLVRIAAMVVGLTIVSSSLRSKLKRNVGRASVRARARYRAACGRSVLGLEVGDIGRSHELEGNIDARLHRFAAGELEGGVDRSLALAGGILE